MSARTKARKRALDLLFEAEARGVNVADLLSERLARPVTEAPLNPYTATLVSGVVAHWRDINELLDDAGNFAKGMPGTARLVGRAEPHEAVALATALLTDDSPKFVNGLLGRLAQVKPTLA